MPSQQYQSTDVDYGSENMTLLFVTVLMVIFRVNLFFSLACYHQCCFRREQLGYETSVMCQMPFLPTNQQCQSLEEIHNIGL